MIHFEITLCSIGESDIHSQHHRLITYDIYSKTFYDAFLNAKKEAIKIKKEDPNIDRVEIASITDYKLFELSLVHEEDSLLYKFE